MAKNDGGPAFPGSKLRREYPGGDNGLPPVYYDAPGMSLRDHFAGIALTRLKYDPSKSHAHTAAEAYRMSDAMIAERKK